MPLFEYQCRTCGRRFEALVVSSRTPSCPQCKSEDLEKQHSTFGCGASGRADVSRSHSGPPCSPGGG